MKKTIKSLDAEMHRQFSEVYDRFDRLFQRMEKSEANTNEKFDSHTTQIVAAMQAMEIRIYDRVENVLIPQALRKHTAETVTALFPWMEQLEDRVEDQEKRISALEGENSI